MTDDEDAMERAIIDALRGDAQAAVPLERRRRVASRLASGAGIMGLTTSVAGATHAALAGGSPVVAGVTLLGLTKTLLVGMGLGAGAGLGLYATFRSSAPAASSAVVAPLVAPAAHAPSTSGPSPTPAVAAAKPAEPVPPPDEQTAPERAAPSAPGTRANPSPELPRDAAPERTRSLAEQQALLDDARAALRRGDGAAALAALRSHIARFPQTVFDEERDAVAIKALVLVDQLDAARQREAAFERRFPASLLTPSLRAVVGTKE